MRAVFVLVGLLFDLVILALSALTLYCVFNTDFLKDGIELIVPYFERMPDRAYVAGAAGALLVLSFRGLFLLIFGRGERDFVLKRSENGTLTIARSTLEHLVDRIAQKQNPPARLSWIRIVQEQSSLRLAVRVRLDIAGCNLGEFVATLDSAVRDYFKGSLGIPVSRLDIKAEADSVTGNRT